MNLITELSSKRGLRNTQVQDIHPILVEFAQRYAEKYTVLNKTNLKQTYCILLNSFSNCFQSNKFHPSADEAVKQLY